MSLAKRLAADGDQSLPDRLAAEHRVLMGLVASRGDRDAFRLLFRYYGPRLKAMMMKSGADGSAADDIVQSVMLTIWRKASYYSTSRGSVSTWIFAIARNQRIDRLKHSSSRPYQDIYEIELMSQEPDAEAQTELKQRALHVERAVAELPEEQRQIIKLSFEQGISHGEIARTLAVPIGTVKSRMRLAYRKLKTKLEDLK